MSLIRYYHRHLLAAIAVVTGLFLVASTFHSPVGHVADYNHNAHGVIDYCTLSGSTTTIHGWAHDPDTPNGNNPKVNVVVGSQGATAQTSIANYHDAAINKYLAANWPNAPTGSIYGFTASFSTLYKGTSYAVSGVAVNSGTSGTNTNMQLDTTGNDVDGISVNNLFTTSRTLPDACLVAKPAPPPSPSPTPSPSPSPTPTPKPKSSGGSSSKSSSTTPTPTSSSGLGSNSDASVETGTLTAVVTIPQDGASSVSVTYGLDSNVLDSNTDSADASSGNATITLLGLSPKSTYYYQVVRTNASGQSTTSSVASFQTAGYTLTLHFINAKNKPVAGIVGSLNDDTRSTSKSTSSGDLSFYNLDQGKYTVTFKYGNQLYSQQMNTDAAGNGFDNPSKTIDLKDTINVAKLTGSSNAGSSHRGLWLTIIIMLVLIGLGFIIWRQRRRAMGAGFVAGGDYALSTLPSAGSSIPPIKPPKKIKSSKKEPETAHLEHVGESLRDMVLKSMHEEAQKRKANDK